MTGTVGKKTSEAAARGSAAPKKMVKKPARVKRGEAGWQAEKSAMTQAAIMEAAIKCLIELGYANTTTALIAEYAGVSRGAMMHHFSSRLSVIIAVIAYLHELRLKEYEELMFDIDDPDQQLTRETIYASVEAAWKYVNLPSFVAYQELLAAARTDEELLSVLGPVERDFEKQFLADVRKIFPHWAQLSIVEPAHDLVQFMMKGMALSHMSMRKKQRSKSLMIFLTDVLWDMYRQGMSQS